MSPSQEDGRQADCIRATLQTLCTLMTSDRPSAQMQLHSEVLGVRTGTYGYAGDTLQSIAPSKAVVREGPGPSQSQLDSAVALGPKEYTTLCSPFFFLSLFLLRSSLHSQLNFIALT